MKKNILLFILATVAAVSCYKEDPIVPVQEEPAYTIEDSSDPAKHYIYETWKNTGVYTLYEFDEVDYAWNVSSISDNILVPMDESMLTEAVDYAREVLFDIYDDDFKKKYFPMKVFLADSLNSDLYASDPLYNDRVSVYGRSYIAIGQIRPETFPKTDEQILEAVGKVNGMLWGDLIYRYSLMEIPDGFFSPCEELYGQNMSDAPEDDLVSYAKGLGFWSFDEFGIYDTILPDRYGDVSDFVEMMTTHTEEEMQAEMEGYETLVIKYNILRNAIQDACGVDLQEIGNAKAANRI